MLSAPRKMSGMQKKEPSVHPSLRQTQEVCFTLFAAEPYLQVSNRNVVLELIRQCLNGLTDNRHLLVCQVAAQHLRQARAIGLAVRRS